MAGTHELSRLTSAPCLIGGAQHVHEVELPDPIPQQGTAESQTIVSPCPGCTIFHDYDGKLQITIGRDDPNNGRQITACVSFRGN